tara:strand:- start:1352 stop:2725 length:1374 start_codon:yes stop_codon:yes gene_type:complete
MPYRNSRYFRYGNPSSCVTDNHWWPGGGGDSNDSVRNSVTSAYMSLFGRYGELGGVEGYVGTWVYGNGPALYGSIYNMVRNGGVSSGELAAVNTFGRHTNMSTAPCPPPPVYGCTDPNAANYNSSATVDNGTCYYNPPLVSISANPNPIISPGSTTITWSVSRSYYQTLTGFGSVASSGSATVTPSDDTVYTLTAYGYGSTSASNSTTVVVYIPPEVTLTVDNTTIVLGESTVLRWSTSGDASTMTINPVPGITNLSSFYTITPTVDTVYTATANGPGGTDSDQITVTVLQPPTVSISGPLSVSYGGDVELSHEQTNATVSYTLTATEYDLDNETNERVIDLGASASANTTYTDTITYHNRGPARIVYTLTGESQGGLQDIEQAVVFVVIDQTPDAIDIPASEDKLRDEEPVITPDIEVVSEQLVVDDIDIPVEVTASQPIQISIDNGPYQDVRQNS